MLAGCPSADRAVFCAGVFCGGETCRLARAIFAPVLVERGRAAEERERRSGAASGTWVQKTTNNNGSEATLRQNY